MKVLARGRDCLSLAAGCGCRVISARQHAAQTPKQHLARAPPTKQASKLVYVRAVNLTGRPKQTGCCADYYDNSRLLILRLKLLLIFSRDLASALFCSCCIHHTSLQQPLLADHLHSTFSTTLTTSNPLQWPLDPPSRVPTGRISPCPSRHHSHTPAPHTTWTTQVSLVRLLAMIPPSSRPCRRPRAARARTACHQAPLTSPTSSPMP